MNSVKTIFQKISEPIKEISDFWKNALILFSSISTITIGAVRLIDLYSYTAYLIIGALVLASTIFFYSWSDAHSHNLKFISEIESLKKSLQSRPIIKKLQVINGIKVDEYGDCFCPLCENLLIILTHQKFVGTKVFMCISCKIPVDVILDNGKHAWPYAFLHYQKQHPQTYLTDDIFKSQYVDQSYKDAGLTPPT